MEKLTKEQAVIIMGYTGIVMCDFSLFHEEVEKRLGHPVWTHQFGSRDFTDNKVKPAFKDDFFKILPAAQAKNATNKARTE